MAAGFWCWEGSGGGRKETAGKTYAQMGGKYGNES